MNSETASTFWTTIGLYAYKGAQYHSGSTASVKLLRRWPRQVLPQLLYNAPPEALL